MPGIESDTAHTRFQFHKGTIRTVDAVVLHDAYIHFNSIKVQLERS